LFKLALRLGYTVNELQRKITSKELSEWMAFDCISPIGDERYDLNAATICTVLFNLNRGESLPKRPIDFMPYVTKETRSKSLSNDIINAFKGLQ